MHRFYVSQELSEGPLMIINSALAHQARTVLRMKPGSEIMLFTTGSAAGWDFRFRVERLTDRMVDGIVTERVKNDREPRVTVTLYMALVKKDRMELVFEKATEVGVTTFVPLITERSLTRSAHGERAEKIIQEAAEQSGRAILPNLTEPIRYINAIHQAKGSGGLCVVAHEKEVRRTLDVAPPASRRISLFIGPEGGFSEQEIMTARNLGFFVTSLSRRVLRAETAAVVGSYAVLHRFGN
jgi:16S rRNA (uracil1498-N3)-methyltransferase